jgi:hypothetical protein
VSPTLGGRRSPDAWSSLHDRARARLAERMTEPLEPEESAWLDAHLAGCGACREIDAAYQSDRASLQAMRVIAPPRDLWARTSAALDVEQGRAGGGRRSRPTRRRSKSRVLAFPGGRLAPIGALGSIAAVMVVGFLVGNALIGAGGPAASPSHGVALGASATPNLVPTPIPVPQADVSWVSTDPDGSIVLKKTPVKGVCPPDQTTGCTSIDAGASNVVTLSVKPKSVHQSPTSGQMIVFGQGTGSGLTMYVINTGKGATPTPAVTPTAAPTATPVAPTATPATASVRPSPSAGGASPSTGAPSPSATPSSTPEPTATAVATPAPTSTASIVPNITPPPSAATLIAVASDLGVLNAETAAYSPDGVWFAFTARPLGVADGSDIYLWHAGDAQAQQVTSDGHSVFAGWVGNRLLGSRAAAPATDDATPSVAPATDGALPDSGELGTTSFIVDPASLALTSISTAAWRPAVDPTGKFVVYWEGTVARDPESGGWRTATGRLVIRSWPIVDGTTSAPSVAPSVAPASPSEPVASPSATASAGSSAAASPTTSPKASKKPIASASASPSASVAPSPSSSPSVPASPSPSPIAPSGLPASIASASGVDWTVAWDETGTHLALWIGDRSDHTFGRLSLLAIGPNGLPAAGGALVADRPALPGFALSDGHLAWATPPGVNAEGSQLWIHDYSGKGGENSSPAQPGANTVVVVQH